MSTFSEQFGDDVMGELTMFDRMVFKGHLSAFFPKGAFKAFLDKQGVLLKGFKDFVQRATADIAKHAETVAERARRPFIRKAEQFTVNKGKSKEAMAAEIARADGVREGLICVMSALEPCMSFNVRGNWKTHQLEAVRAPRKCLHYYFYFIDPELGLLHVRLQSWFPMEIQIWMNGREWLARQLDKRGIAYERHENSLLRIGDVKLAQELCTKFAHRKWPRLLDALAARVNPWIGRIRGTGFGSYYWVLDQFEIATDIMFKDRPTLRALMPDLYEHAILEFGAENVMRFLGRKPHGAFKGEVITDLKKRPEGWRVKHSLKCNSIKMYDKWSVLRIETTINKPNEFRILRTVKQGGSSKWRWVPMTKGVANMWGYYEAGICANNRYLSALAAVQPRGKALEELDDLCRTKTINGRRCPRLIPIEAHAVALFAAVMAGEHHIVGFRNADIAARLFPGHSTLEDTKRHCAFISRRISTLRARGLVAKKPNSRCYRVTPKGAAIMGTAIRLRKKEIPQELRVPARLPAL
jgi:hypothetical protein